MSVSSLDLGRLKRAATLTDLAAVLGVEASTLSFALYIMPVHERYHTFTVPKKRGGERIINAPNERLKFIQKKLADILLRIERDLEAPLREAANNGAKKLPILSHGFKKELSIVTNAHKHKNRRFVFNLDLADFFPSLNFGRVRGFFLHNNHFQLPEKVATLLAQIACFQNELPQGSPCSPPIANLIANILDVRLNALARSCQCSYTRYADDITFSTNNKEFPSHIAAQNSDGHWVPSDKLISRISASGFRINESKTRMQFRDSRQEATGLIVNRKLNVPVEYYKETRALCHYLFHGRVPVLKIEGGSIPVTTSSLRGRLNHIFHIRGIETGHKKPEKSKYPGYFKLYAQFLDYVSFWGIEQPTIICEGKTDNIYLKNAMRALKPTFPHFWKFVDGKEQQTINFFKYTKCSNIIQDLSGGNGQLKNLVHEFEKRTRKFRSLPKAPVIIITDVDKGATDLFKAMKKILGYTVDGDKSWYYLRDNLYIVPVPKGGRAEVAIEDLFDPALLEVELEGKKFDRTNHESDGEKVYSKFTFATKVVAARRDEIDFGRFQPLLQAILDVQADYAQKIAHAVPSPAQATAA
ncbi:RNA-directed DNA polymerase [Rhizobium laguerreae]|uniref:retron Ec67 family RNA-directed DNA polymerase/endonuclease n=1 Tax=Rhizobium laguerreae TaxID=1076926 RepID=UPI001C901FB4|nr:retron Ec67 family RNA-directed DNA polymerase/endonuclease [Rhizobium laguerreae]MBY3330853.1 RNA-directed DNA polymerase [Rhizobium laguerreae]